MSELVQAARKYIGHPFRHRARGPIYYDCAGLLLQAFIDIGKPMKDLKYYGREPHKDGLRQIIQLNLGEPVYDEMQAGDLCLMRFSTEPHHIGLIGDYLHGGFSLIHADGTQKRVVEHRLDKKWQSRIIERYRSAV